MIDHTMKWTIAIEATFLEAEDVVVVWEWAQTGVGVVLIQDIQIQVLTFNFKLIVWNGYWKYKIWIFYRSFISLYNVRSNVQCICIPFVSNFKRFIFIPSYVDFYPERKSIRPIQTIFVKCTNLKMTNLNFDQSENGSFNVFYGIMEFNPTSIKLIHSNCWIRIGLFINFLLFDQSFNYFPSEKKLFLVE